MGERKPGIPEAELAAWDQELLSSYARAWEAGAAAAGPHLVCRVGCTSCCIGVFEITALDAWRLRRGLAALEAKDPQRAAEVRRRAQAQWALLAPRFPGDAATGALAADDEAREVFCRTFADLPCPALDPSSGACLVYEARPLSCRSFGLPCLVGEERLPPCGLNFRQARPEDVEAATVRLDPEDVEGRILRRLGNPPDTVVPAALAVDGASGTRE